MSINTYFMLETIAGASSYPLKMDNVVIVVPVGKIIPAYLTMIYSIPICIVLAIFGSSFAIAVFLYRFSKYKCLKLSRIDCFFVVYSLFFNTPMESMQKRPSAVKILLLSWILSSFIITFAFQSILTSTLVAPKRYDTLKSIEEVQNSNVTICISLNFTNRFNFDIPLKDRFVDMPTDDILVLVRKKQHSKCYFALTWSYLLPMFQMDASLDNVFNVIHEALIPGYGVFLFHSKSPFVAACNRHNLLYREFGLTFYRNHVFKEDYMVEDIKEKHSDKFLTFKHIQGVFYVLCMGLCLAFVVFVVEHCVHYWRNITGNKFGGYYP